MKKLVTKYISVFLLNIFLFTFTFQHISSFFRDLSANTQNLVIGKFIKAIHTPNEEGSASDESPIEENESKDEKEKESETKFHSDLAIIFFAQSEFSQEPGNKSQVRSGQNIYAHKSQYPLYLLTRTFRI